MPLLILASASPARLTLLTTIGFPPDQVIPADIDETPLKNEDPKTYVIRLAIQKAQTIAQQHPNAFIIAADSIACIGKTILGKPTDKDDARRILTLLSGRKHRLYTGLCMISPTGTIRHKRVMTSVQFKRLSHDECETFLCTDEWKNKCGGYGIQKDTGAFIQSINGSVSNVVGLPTVETKNMLLGLGYKK